MLSESQVRAESLLDIGAGIGVLHHELLALGARSAVHVEVAAAYVEAAREEAARRRQSDRVRFVHGDVVALADQLAPADLVTLDRVICCYPGVESLVRSTAAKARRYWAASFPRDRWITKAHMRWENARRARAGNPFRSFVHPVPGIYALLGTSGLVPLKIDRGLFWEIVLCARTGAAEVT
jgi:magnesium-protoporphyrin O-methyltransferase